MCHPKRLGKGSIKKNKKIREFSLSSVGPPPPPKLGNTYFFFFYIWVLKSVLMQRNFFFFFSGVPFANSRGTPNEM